MEASFTNDAVSTYDGLRAQRLNQSHDVKICCASWCLRKSLRLL